MAGMEDPIKEPSDWSFESPSDLTFSEANDLNEMNIQYQEPIYTPLDERAVKGIERVLSVEKVRPHLIEKIRLMDDETVEIVYYGDGSTEVSDVIISRVQNIIHEWFGELWQIERKIDNRRSRGWGGDADRNRNVQRLVVRRMEGRRFQYKDETDHEYRVALHGTPDGVSEDAVRWSEVEHIGEKPDAISEGVDLFVYESGTGTKHLIRGLHSSIYGLRRGYVTEGYDTECGITIDAEDIADPETLTHYAEHVAENMFAVDFDPESIFGDDLCQSCWRSVGMSVTDENGNLEEIRPPRYDWDDLLDVEVEG